MMNSQKLQSQTLSMSHTLSTSRNTVDESGVVDSELGQSMSDLHKSRRADALVKQHKFAKATFLVRNPIGWQIELDLLPAWKRPRRICGHNQAQHRVRHISNVRLRQPLLVWIRDIVGTDEHEWELHSLLWLPFKTQHVDLVRRERGPLWTLVSRTAYQHRMV